MITSKALFLLSITVWSFSAFSQIPLAELGQEGNGGFVYKDAVRYRRAITVMHQEIFRLKAKLQRSPDSLFNELKKPVPRLEFLDLLDHVIFSPDTIGLGRSSVKVPQTYMMNILKLGADTCVIIHGPMYVALMYIEDEQFARKFFRTNLIHEMLHVFSYSEEEADLVAPYLYEKLGGT